MNVLKFVIVFVVLLANISHSHAEQPRLRIGMSAALSGNAQAVGLSFRNGAVAYFQATNAAGGINGYQLALRAYDDANQAGRNNANLIKLMDQDKVLAILGNANQNTGALPAMLVRQRKILFFAPYSGSSELRKYPPDRYVMHFRASYAEEAAALVDGLLQAGVNPARVVLFSSHEAYGNSIHRSASTVLKLAGHDAPLPHIRYGIDQNDDLQALVNTVSTYQPEAVIVIGEPILSIEFLRLARPVLPRVHFASISLLSADTLIARLDKLADGIILTQVVPPLDAELPAINTYVQDLNRYVPQQAPNAISLEGYLAAKVLVAGLAKTGRKPMQETLINALEQMQAYDVGLDLPISYSSDDHDGLTTVWASIIRNNKQHSLDWANLRH